MVSITFSYKNLRRFLTLVPALLILAGSTLRVFDLYELQTYDWRCQLRGPRPVSDNIVLIDIWDDTLEQLGAWPFDRSFHADLIKVLSAYGAKAIGFDVLFVEPREGDEAVAQAAQHANNVYFVYALLDPKNQKGRFVSEKLLAPLIGPYEKSAKGTGHVNTKADLDGKRRRMAPVIYYQDKPCYQLSFRMAMDVLGLSPEKVVMHPRESIEFSKDLRVPLDEEGYFIVNFAGKWEKTFTHYSYYDILASYLEKLSGQPPRIDLEKLKGKICFIGLTSLGSHDTSPVPIQSVYPMVGTYANVMNSLLNKDFIHRWGRLQNLLLLLVMGLGVGFISFRFRPMAALLRVLAALAFFTVGGIFLFMRWGIWVDLFYPITVFVLIYSAATLGRSILEIKKRELIESELKIASQIQKSFLPQALPDQKGLSLAVYMKPAKQVGGDLYTFLPLEGSKTGVMVGDVSGKGTPAALFMAKVVSEFKFSARDNPDPAQVLTSLNNSITAESTGGLFVTLSYAIFDLQYHKFILSNGGHLPIVLVGVDGQTGLLSAEEGMPIGVLADVSFSNLERPLRAGDIFAFYSDGVTEARNRKKEEYSVETMQKVMRENRHLSAEGILNKVVHHLNQFMGKADQHDDITLIIVKVDSL